MPRLGVAVAGLGRIGRLHAEIIKVWVKDAELVAVVDVIESLAKSVGESFNVKWYTDYDKALRDPRVDAVIIAAPTFLHRDMIVKAAEAGKHVFVEKPLTVTSEEAEEVRQAVEKHHVKLQVGYNRRFDYAYRKARKDIEDGVIGKPLAYLAVARDPDAPPGWVADPKLSGGIFLDQLSHDFDMARWLMRDEIVEVHVVGGAYIHESVKEKGDLDVVSIVFKFANGAQGFVHGTRKFPYGYELRTEVFGDKGVIYVGTNRDELYARGTKDGLTYFGAPWFVKRFYDAYVNELTSFVKAVLEDKEPECTVVDGLRAVQIAEACWRSVREGRPVRVGSR